MNPPKPYPKQTFGLTLVEVLVSLAIIGVASGMFGYFISSLQTTKTARERTTALAYARDYLEGLRVKWQTLEGYQTLSLATPNNPPTSYAIKVKVHNNDGNTIFSYPGGPGTDDDVSALRKVTLTFTDEQQRTVSLVTNFARPTPIPNDEDEDAD